MLTITHTFSQSKGSNNWISGHNGNKIDFNNNTIQTSQNLYSLRYFSGGNSCISDSNENLILASDGYNVYNSLGGYIEEGDTLIPHSLFIYEDGWSAESQESIFLPMDSNKYYFVTPTFSDSQFDDCAANNNCYFDLLLYNVIDMNANAGAGKVTQRMVPLLQNARLRKTQMMACRHGNGKDWWLLKQEGDSANVHTFLFTQDSVYDKGVQVFSEPVWGSWDLRGQSTFNSDGSIYATTSHGGGLSGFIMISDFDRCYGVLSKPYIIQMPSGSQHDPSDTTIMERLPVGLAFSPNKQFLYVISMCNIYQYDLQDSTWFHVAGLDTSYQKFQEYETAYLAPDNKIYIGNWGGLSKQMSRIDNPDVKGAGCNFCPRCLRMDSLSGVFSLGTPPCMPNYGLGAQVCWPLSTHNVVVENELVVYPNPTNNMLYLEGEFLNHQVNEIKIYTILGQLVYDKKVKTLTGKVALDLKGLNKGVYFLKCNKLMKKVVIE